MIHQLALKCPHRSWSMWCNRSNMVQLNFFWIWQILSRSAAVPSACPRWQSPAWGSWGSSGMPKPSRFWRRHCHICHGLSWDLDCRNSKTTSLRPISFNLDSHLTFKPFKHQLYPKVLYNVSVHITLKNWEARQQRPPSESAPETLQDCWHACSGKCSTDVCSCTASNYFT